MATHLSQPLASSLRYITTEMIAEETKGTLFHIKTEIRKTREDGRGKGWIIAVTTLFTFIMTIVKQRKYVTENPFVYRHWLSLCARFRKMVHVHFARFRKKVERFCNRVSDIFP